MARFAAPPATPSSHPPAKNTSRLGAVLALASAVALASADSAQAQFIAPRSGSTQPVSRNEPVYYTADSAEYDRDLALVTLSGHVEIWQGDRVLRADKVTFDRNTNVAAATGHVVLLEPDGQVLFSDYAELSQGLRDGVLTHMRALLAANGKLAANGGRRTEARINELSRVIYSTCNACQQHPDEPLLWDIRARSAVQDLDNKRIEYRDAVVDMFGLPVAWFPYLTHPDPSQRRASGFLIPTFGQTTHLGTFAIIPYYWAIDDQQDATISPYIASRTGPALDLQYRRAFNDGTVTVNSSIANDNDSLQGHIFTKGQFVIDDTWRWGFDINRASSNTYLRDFRVHDITDVLTSQVYVEGFGQGAYTRLDAHAYQGLTSSIDTARLPYVLPRYQYSFVGEPDALGGRLSLDAGSFNVLRSDGTDTQRASLGLNWERPATGALGDLWKLVLHVDGAGYNARDINNFPTWGNAESASSAQAMPTLALDMNWPFQRDAGNWGTQVVEPIVQLIAAPNGSSYTKVLNPDGTTLYVRTLIPNEDSPDFEFTDANLFSLNRFSGIDRLEGGPRANVALHGAWYFSPSSSLDAQIGQGYRLKKDEAFPIGSGLEGTVTDVVSHVSFTPTPWLDLTTRQRFDRHNFNIRFVDALATTGPSWLRVGVGYLYSTFNPYTYYDTPPAAVLPNNPRNEVSLNATTTYGHWRLGGFARRNIAQSQMDGVGVNTAYEDECFVFSTNFYKRYTSYAGDHGATTFLFQITLKTVGTFGFNAL
jgi:LPS-assembly protein